ncbi:MAG: hypothetical protein L3J29_01495 [Cyclobacteriaceae bacterium]|nr:hypothetical protein [Cyclobacteriaceae bacterium]
MVPSVKKKAKKLVATVNLLIHNLTELTKEPVLRIEPTHKPLLLLYREIPTRKNMRERDWSFI